MMSGVAQHVDLQFGDLSLLVNRETILSLFHFVNLNILDQLKSSTSEDKVLEVTSSQTTSSQQAQTSPEGSINVVASFGHIRLYLNRFVD